MCKKKNYHATSNTQIDKCMRIGIKALGIVFKHSGMKILACCCGHGKYPISIVYQLPNYKTRFELFSAKVIPRQRNFYKKDKQGFYFIPEAIEK